MGGSWMGLPEVLLGGLEKAIGIHHAAAASHAARLRRARPDATPAEIIAALEKQYLAAVTSTGAAVGGAAAAPCVGTVAALALSGGEAAVFLETTALFALAVAEVHGIRVDEAERRRTLVLAIVLGDRGAMLVEKLTGQTAQHWAELLPDAIPLSSITAINKTLGRWFVTKFECKLSALAVGKAAPFGVGAAIGAGGNHAFGRQVVNASRRVFGPPPVRFADDGTGLRLAVAGASSRAVAVQRILADHWDRTVARLTQWAADLNPLVVRAAVAAFAEPALPEGSGLAQHRDHHPAGRSPQRQTRSGHDCSVPT